MNEIITKQVFRTVKSAHKLVDSRPRRRTIHKILIRQYLGFPRVTVVAVLNLCVLKRVDSRSHIICNLSFNPFSSFCPTVFSFCSLLPLPLNPLIRFLCICHFFHVDLITVLLYSCQPPFLPLYFALFVIFPIIMALFPLIFFFT